MTYLIYNGQTRAESDAGTIATLIRKGWTETTAPVPPEPTAEEQKEAAFRATIDAGHCIQPEDYCLAMDDRDRENWSQLLVLLRESEALGAINGDSPVSFLDITGTQRTATLTRFRQMIVTLGQAYQTAFFTRHS